MTPPREHRITVPELLAPAGSLDAVRAAFANGANAVYLGAERFNARDEGAQLTLDEVATACDIARTHGGRVYLTLNTLIKPAELNDALHLLGAAIDRGIHAVLVQDLGLVRLIQAVFPEIEIHGSTQMTVHDTSGAALMRALGIHRIVLARENTLDDIRAIRAAVPDIGLEAFVHGALCIAYSGQCFMSGMISERSANRGSCAQSCRKDYVLTDVSTGDELDRGYLISARDLGAYEHVAGMAEAGVSCLKIEGRKKKPEFVATATHAYREFLDRIAIGDPTPPSPDDVRPLVQIFSRGFTPGMLTGRAGRDYVTRTHPDNRGLALGDVVDERPGEITVDVRQPIAIGDGVVFEPPEGAEGTPIGFGVSGVRTISTAHATTRQAITSRLRVPVGWRVRRTLDTTLMEQARASFSGVLADDAHRLTPLTVRAFGSAGSPLKCVFTAGPESITLQSDVPLAPASAHPLDIDALRRQLGRLGGTPFVLGDVDTAGLVSGMFLPMRELNRLRQRAVEALSERRDWATAERDADRDARIAATIAAVTIPDPARVAAQDTDAFILAADVYTIDDALTAADAGANEIAFDPFLRHPVPPVSRVRALAEALGVRGITVRVRTPTIVRPEERRSIQKWLDTGLPLLSGHLGLVAELAREGRDVVADYAVNCFNQHTAAELFRVGARRITCSVELTAEEMAEVIAPWSGVGFDALVYGRPEGMTIEHCVLSAAFDREPTTCRDLCIQKHPLVQIRDPAGYEFPVATDAACRNRLLHSRPIEGSEYLPRLWRSGVRGYRLLFNLPGDPVAALVRAYRASLDALRDQARAPLGDVRALVGSEYTRGHFARAV